MLPIEPNGLMPTSDFMKSRRGSTPTVNDPDVFKFGLETAEKLFGKDGALELPYSSMAGEDFALYSLGVPGAMFWIGTRSEEHAPHVRTGNNLHNSNFEVDDRMLPRGAAFLSTAAIEYIKKLKGITTGEQSDEL